MSYNKNKEALKGISGRKFDGRGLKIGICHTRWNQEIIDAIVSGAVDELQNLGVKNEDVIVIPCPGAYELPYTASRIIKAYDVDAVICVGCLIKGDTMHFEYISEGVTQGIMKLNLDTGIPVLFGVLECLNEEQARIRAGLTSNGHNHGPEWAQSAVEMALIRKSLKPSLWSHVKTNYRGIVGTALICAAIEFYFRGLSRSR